MALQLASLAGNDGFKQAVGQALASGRMPHAVLIAAPGGCGRGFAARLLAADYLYPEDSHAAKAAAAGQNPELLLVQGEGKSGQIPVERIREIRQEVYRSSLSASGRAVWIRDAHRMAAPAANALLKVLEEPPAGVLFILTTQDASSLPLTIVSRCILFTLVPPSVAACEEFLSNAAAGQQPAISPATLAAIYGGRIGLGLKALQAEERMQVLQDALAIGNACAAANVYEVLRVFAGYEGRADGDRDRRDALLDDVTSVLETPLNGISAPGLPAINPFAASHLLAAVQTARSALRGNAAPKITFTALAAQMAAALRSA